MIFILYNYSIKKIANKLWKSKWLNNFWLYNYLLNKQIHKKINDYKDKPNCVRIENTNICNAKCTMCSREQMTRQQGIMDNALFKEIVKQCMGYEIKNINLHNFGEPLMDKDFIKKVLFAKKLGIEKVTTNTNASLLTEEVSKQLIEAGLDELFVSIDAYSKDTYERIRRGLNYEQLIDNLLNFIAIKKKLNAHHIKLIVSFVLTDQDINEVNTFIKFWLRKADYISISYAHDWLGSKKDIFGNKRLNYPCKLPFSELTISWNGDYVLCCADFNSEVVLGNFKESNIIKTWEENEILNRYRKANLVDYGFSISPCQSCTLNTVWWF